MVEGFYRSLQQNLVVPLKVLLPLDLFSKVENLRL